LVELLLICLLAAEKCGLLRAALALRFQLNVVRPPQAKDSN